MKYKITSYIDKRLKKNITALINGNFGVTPIKTETQLVEYALEKLLEEYLEDYNKKVRIK